MMAHIVLIIVTVVIVCIALLMIPDWVFGWASDEADMGGADCSDTQAPTFYEANDPYQGDKP